MLTRGSSRDGSEIVEHAHSIILGEGYAPKVYHCLE